MKSIDKSLARRLSTATLALGALAGLAALGSTNSLAQDSTSPTASPNPPAPPQGSVGGLGDINLFPKRVVINGRREIASIGLYNKTAHDGDYEIKIIDMAMTPEGQLIAFNNGLDEAAKARVQTASPMLRHSPRRVTLRGSESQLIRVMARAPADTPDGEYRSHFLVSSVPQIDGGFSIESAVGERGGEGIGVTIRPRFGISIPVIVRVGETTLDVGIESPSLVTAPDGSKAIGFLLTREGTRSAFGDVFVTAAGSSASVAISKGIGIYTEVNSRQVFIPVDPEADPALLAPGARLKIEFIDDDFEPGAKLATQEFVIR